MEGPPTGADHPSVTDTLPGLIIHTQGGGGDLGGSPPFQEQGQGPVWDEVGAPPVLDAGAK